MAYKGVTQEEIVRRIYEREDNIYLKKEAIRDFASMYNEEIRKALMDGERVYIKNVGSITPKIRRCNSGYQLPTVSDADEEFLPYIDVRFHNNRKFKEAITGKLRKNLINNRKLELSNGKPDIPRGMEGYFEELDS